MRAGHLATAARPRPTKLLRAHRLLPGHWFGAPRANPASASQSMRFHGGSDPGSFECSEKCLTVHARHLSVILFAASVAPSAMGQQAGPDYAGLGGSKRYPCAPSVVSAVLGKHICPSGSKIEGKSRGTGYELNCPVHKLNRSWSGAVHWLATLSAQDSRQTVKAWAKVAPRDSGAWVTIGVKLEDNDGKVPAHKHAFPLTPWVQQVWSALDVWAVSPAGKECHGS